MAVTYTRDEDFDQLVDKDPTTEIIGFIDYIIAPATVTSKNRKTYELFKFVISNGSNRRVLCLVWGKKLIEKYQPEIIIHRILHIENGFTKAALMNSEKNSLDVIAFEVIISDITVIVYKGIHQLELAPPPEEPTDVDFETIIAAEGLIRIKGYIKTKFARSLGRFETMSYGCGAIIDGVSKLTVQISNFGTLDLEKGVYVTIIGTVVNRDGLMKVCWKDDGFITPDPTHPQMVADLLIRGTKQIVVSKRKSPEES